MSTIYEQVTEAMKDAMRSRDQSALTLLRSLKAALMNSAIEKGGAGTVLDEAEATAVVRKQLKQREDSARTFREGGRPELATNEELEIAMLSKFLPAALTDDEIQAIVEAAIKETGATGKAQMGAVMKAATALAGGRADGKTLSKAVAARLA